MEQEPDFTIIDNTINNQYGGSLRLQYKNNREFIISRNGGLGEVVPNINWYIKYRFKELNVEEVHFLVGCDVLVKNLQSELDKSNTKLEQLFRYI